MPGPLRVAIVVLSAAMFASCSQAQPAPGALSEAGIISAATGYHALYSFGASPDGEAPKAGLTVVNGTLYGTTYLGGKHGDGTVFSISTAGIEKVLYSFRSGNDGANPSASLAATRGLLYGTTEYGGAPNRGTVFRVSTAGAEKTLHQFFGYYYQGRTYYDGANPVASLLDVDGKLYGTTLTGGFNEIYGTVFRVGTSGLEKVLYSFNGYGLNDGANPVASLVEVKRSLYGTTEFGGEGSGSGGYGTAFTVSLTGAEEKVLHEFAPGPDGFYPEAGLADIKGILYGTTANGGANSGGTAFNIATSGSLTLLHSFGSGSDGSGPCAQLLSVRGMMYGTTSGGGAYGKGTVFRLSLDGKERVLHSFGNATDGATPVAGLIAVNGTLYGTTSAGGTYGEGTVFSLKP